jgi:hypothetical protein
MQLYLCLFRAFLMSLNSMYVFPVSIIPSSLIYGKKESKKVDIHELIINLYVQTLSCICKTDTTLKIKYIAQIYKTLIRYAGPLTITVSQMKCMFRAG